MVCHFNHFGRNLKDHIELEMSMNEVEKPCLK
jgi:hypothetical protein